MNNTGSITGLDEYEWMRKMFDHYARFLYEKAPVEEKYRQVATVLFTLSGAMKDDPRALEELSRICTEFSRYMLVSMQDGSRSEVVG